MKRQTTMADMTVTVWRKTGVSLAIGAKFAERAKVTL